MKNITKALICITLTVMTGYYLVAADNSELKLISGTHLEKTKFSKIDYAIFETRKNAFYGTEQAKNEDATVKGVRALNIQTRASKISDPKLIAAIETMHSEIIHNLYSGFPDMPIEVTDNMGLNAEATELGQITFGMGLLKSLKYQDEMVFVAAHEIAHIIVDHFKAQEERDAFREFLSYSDVILKEVDSYTNENLSEYSTTAIKAAAIGELIINPVWGKRQEYEADKIAVDLMIRAGYSVEGASTFMAKLADFEKIQEEKLQQSCGVSGNPIASIFGKLDFTKKPKKIAPPRPECDYLTGLVDSLFDSHATPKKRRKKILSYYEKYYGNRDIVSMREFEGGNMLSFASPNGPAMRTILATDSIEAFIEGDYEKARELARQSLVESDKFSIKPRLANYTIENYDQNYKKAVHHLDVAIESENASPIIYNLRIEHHRLDKEYADAVNLLIDTGYRWDLNDDIKPDLIELLVLRDFDIDVAGRQAYDADEANRLAMAEKAPIKLDANKHKKKKKKSRKKKKKKKKKNKYVEVGYKSAAYKMYVDCQYNKDKDDENRKSLLKDIAKKCTKVALANGVIKKKEKKEKGKSLLDLF